MKSSFLGNSSSILDQTPEINDSTVLIDGVLHGAVERFPSDGRLDRRSLEDILEKEKRSQVSGSLMIKFIWQESVPELASDRRLT